MLKFIKAHKTTDEVFKAAVFFPFNSEISSCSSRMLSKC
jgi:hypothetical protein